MEYISKIIVVLALLFMSFGILGLFRFKDFYSRILITSKVETLGFITIMFGVMFHSGFSFFTLKVLLILFLIIITNPLATHAIARSAYISGYTNKKEKK
ncbi:monovalent cation/H(+) antiporter subunit G [Mobilitalea sibirica]|uniref:Monovalent cation/H(+) antiporter subunit G n=1 Tax=Mobilitalea sibirica TaxID=1462919 RepID=A0A8J7H011_9FIRM|nr:monovalent cation/H(+) antiporter subunit G [Mobilitalea sibirica]MBH1939345.1 monovalent cation/H(+) antiporter subunit G [Mobilitalea sibirica]